MAGALQERTTAVLRRMVEAHPLSQLEIQRRAGLNATFFARIWKSRTPSLPSLDKLFPAMEISSEEFFRRVTLCDPAEHLEAPGTPDQAVGKRFRTAMRTVFLGGDGTATEQGVAEDLAAMARVALPEDLERSFRADSRWRSEAAVEVAVEHLALVRYRDPVQSISLAQALLSSVANSGDRDRFVLVARALIDSNRLGGWCSSAAALGRWLVAGSLAQSDKAKVGTSLTSVGLLVGRAKFSAALAVARSAIETARRCDARTEFSAEVGLARSLLFKMQVNQATYTRLMESMARSKDCCWRQSVAAHHIATTWLTAEERFPEASWHLQSLQDLLPAEVPYLNGYALLAEARLARCRGDFGAAASAGALAVEQLATINPFDTALASLELIEIELVRERSRSALRIAEQTRTLLMARETNEFAEAALVELAKIRAASDLSARLDQIRVKLYDGQRLGLCPIRSVRRQDR